jgi:hypothetical protein
MYKNFVRKHGEDMNKPYIWMDDLGTWFTDEDYKSLDDSLKEDMIPLYKHPAELTEDEIMDSVWLLNLIGDMPESPTNEDLFNFAYKAIRKAQENEHYSKSN